MGFLGRIRSVALRSLKNGVYDVKKISDDLVLGAKRVETATDISGFFSTKYVRLVNEVPVLGEIKLMEFSRFAREGNFEKSFGRAFPNNAALANLSVRQSLNRLLLESRRTLPDFKYARNLDLMENARAGFGVDPKILKTSGDLSRVVETTPKLRGAMTRLVAFAKNNRRVLLFGTVVSIGVPTFEKLYETFEKQAREQSGCFAYWTDTNGNIHKCKIQAYSCSTAANGKPCLKGFLPSEIDTNTDCEQSRDSLCLHCSDDEKLNENLPENVSLKCEEKTAGEVMLEAIGNTLGNVWNTSVTGLRTIFLYAAIFLVIIVVLVVVINLAR